MTDPLYCRAFATVLRRERRKRDLSQDALARAARITAKHISAVEQARIDPRLTTTASLARALGLLPGELVTLVDEQVEATDA